MGRRTWWAAAVVVAVVAGGCTPAWPPASVAPLIDGAHRTYGATAFDVDGDGDEDLLLNLHGYEGSGLYLNDGSGGLTDSHLLFQPHAGAPMPPDRHDCAVADVDRNGRIDVFCVTGAEVGAKEFPWQTNELQLQQADGTFQERSDAWGVTEPWTRGREVAFVDVDGDVWPDLVTTADARPDGQRSETIVYLDDSGTGFVDIGAAGLPRLGGVRCLEKTDWNGDGRTDLALCPLRGGVRLYEATGTSRFRDVTTALGAGPTSTESWAVQFADLDHDGHDDLVRANTTSVQVRLWSVAEGRFVAGQSFTQPDARSLALGRWDADDDLDLYVLNRGCATCSPPTNPPDVLYEGKGDGRFVRRTELAGQPGNGDVVAPWTATPGGPTRWVVLQGHGPVVGPVQVVGR